ncbi:MAG TPA: leucyl/phenylalanyl-tRNA--protein transferase [Flavobacterium sp.]|jgi:leucyl/phenylalanyl-tRNA---protein transferase|uniref:leucyl/phenylalanyl-tRNA--protein transferase n=1 Tax=Flavobacterium sp. TaxID=239 RepID=UPI002B5A0F67|nr:leucyl/phenylalanyl-tRNA--protein transferase [Flavobacterium sp.]MCA0349224.1 leucyl/phenylalanyl-tRNA--protein transferase [Bacteroidota bacterium]HPW97895.1 leucyl/phenylalanyl-tRNA--protein transferase [Flavobacterium sp.]HQA74319.1 leucyl/phenylalanyl-tRNA--protein transferase [Flavobacterium sp.]
MYYVTKKLYFPPVEEASYEGILAIGGDLSTERLLLAYRNGIFPWFNAEEPILWWSPSERMVVAPQLYKICKSTRNLLNQKKFKVTFNHDFRAVITNCQQIERKDQDGTWITNDLIEAYVKLHEMGFAQSVEVWQNDELVGGLYGVDLGHVFCGESMFSKVSNASKIAFVTLINHLKEKNYKLLDCQVHNDHLEKLGAFEISRETFMKILKS